MTDVVIAVDVGGTTIKGALVDAGGRTVAESRRPTPAGADHVVAGVRDTLGSLVHEAARGDVDVRAVGLAVPGDVDADAGVARYSANLGWRDVAVAAFTEGLVDGVPAVLDHDVGCAALAEHTLGATKDEGDACVVVIGTGIASVGWTGGRRVRGARDLAGEIGHVPVRPGGERCACGQRGCLETYASAAAIGRRYTALTGTTLDAAQIVARLGSDAAAAEVWADAIDALATACVTVTMLDDPAVIALAGGLSEAGEALARPLRTAVSDGLTWRPAPRIEISPLGGRAGRLGIALLAWQAAGLDIESVAPVWTRHLREAR